MKRNKTGREALTFGLGLLLVAAVIQLLGAIRNDRLVFPDVREIAGTFFRLLGEGRTWRLMGTTLIHLAEALAVSTLLGILLGTGEGLSPFLRTLLRPMMILLRAMPMIVLVVVIMVVTRYDRAPVIAAALVLTPMISEAVSEGIQHIDPVLLDVYRLNSGLNARVLCSVHLPLTAGYLRQAFVNAAGMGLKVVVSTEYLVQTRDSLGKAVYSSAYFNEYAEIYAYALIMVFLVLLLTEGLPALGRMLLRLREGQGPQTGE